MKIKHLTFDIYLLIQCMIFVGSLMTLERKSMVCVCDIVCDVVSDVVCDVVVMVCVML